MGTTSLSTDTKRFSYDGPRVNNETASTSANLCNVGFSQLTSTAAQTLTIDTPFEGAVKYVFKTSTSTATSTLVPATTACTFDGSNRTLTFDVAGKSVTLIGISPTRWAVVTNTGTVAVSA